MHLDLTRTIIAVGSGLASSRRAVVRISGRDTQQILKELILDDIGVGNFLTTRTAQMRACTCQIRLVDRKQRSVAVPANIYFWPDGRSFTGEPAAELHVLGSLPLVEMLMESIIALGAAPADRGEFTLRSFLAGKLDLTQAEAVLGVIEANSADELSSALAQLGGNISVPVRALRDRLLELTAHLEAGLDFVEEDIEFISAKALTIALETIGANLELLSAALDSRGVRSRMPEVVLAGMPNAGKSSLFNVLVGDARAIVSEEAGTTRDAVTGECEIGELRIRLVDTAGIEQLSESSPRALAQQMLHERLATADLILLCFDQSCPPDANWVAEQIQRLSVNAPVLLVGTKSDLAVNDGSAVTSQSLPQVSLSVFDRTSIAQLRQTLLQRLADAQRHMHSTSMHHAAMRSREAIGNASASIWLAIDHVEHAGEELVAMELRLAIDELAAVIGEVHTEDILGQIFSRFCIGK